MVYVDIGVGSSIKADIGCDYLYMEMSYVVNESDFYNPEFYWHYQDPSD